MKILLWTKKPYKSENGSLLLRFELPFPNHCSTVVSQQYQVLCIMIDKLSSVVLANCWLLQYPWFCFGSPWSPASFSVPPLIAIFFQILSYFSFFHVTQGLLLIFSVPEGLPDSISVILKGYQSTSFLMITI